VILSSVNAGNGPNITAAHLCIFYLMVLHDLPNCHNNESQQFFQHQKPADRLLHNHIRRELSGGLKDVVLSN